MFYTIFTFLLIGTAFADDITFHLRYSEKLDAAVFLNALSEEPRFNADWQQLGETWKPKIRAEIQVAKAFERWQTRGIQLAYLLSATEENNLSDFIRRFENPEELIGEIESKIDEPAYQNVLDDFKENYNDIYVLFAFFLENGFLQMRQKEYGTILESLRQSCQENLQRLDKHQFANYLHLFTGRKMMDLNVFILFQAI